MVSREIAISPDIVIRIRAYPSRRQRALQALVPNAVLVLMGALFLVTVLANA
jgi:hypothetical protein